MLSQPVSCTFDLPLGWTSNKVILFHFIKGLDTFEIILYNLLNVLSRKFNISY
jgi:hypothetical protein